MNELVLIIAIGLLITIMGGIMIYGLGEQEKIRCSYQAKSLGAENYSYSLWNTPSNCAFYINGTLINSYYLKR